MYKIQWIKMHGETVKSVDIFFNINHKQKLLTGAV